MPTELKVCMYLFEIVVLLSFLISFTLVYKLTDQSDVLCFSTMNNITRHANDKISIRRCNLDIKKYSFSFRTERAWNRLAVETRRAKSIVSFKRLLDQDRRKEVGLYDYD